MTATATATPTDVPSFVVINTNDDGPGSLRQALLYAEADPDTNTISFAIPGDGVHTITLDSALPHLSYPITIDGTTQPGSACATDSTPGNLLIELDGTNVTDDYGLTLGGGSSTVRGLIINRFYMGIVLQDNGDNVIACNYIGTDPTGTIARPNITQGVFIDSISNNIIGGADSGSGNLISGNGGAGIEMYTSSTSTGNVIQGNFIGVNANGTSALPNGTDGISTNFMDMTQIGGTTPAERNVISGNLGFGIQIRETEAGGTVIEGNFIGTNATGTAAIPNAGSGIWVADGGGITIGGSGAARNVISGNGMNGILWGGVNGSTIQDNYIGVAADGTTPLGNQENGIRIVQSSNNTIGNLPTDPGGSNGNVIANSAAIGIAVGMDTSDSSVSNAILGNSIYNNGNLDIDLGSDGVTPNDSGIAPNSGQNHPVLTSIVLSGTSAMIGGSLSGTTVQPNAAYHVEFFSNTVCSAAGSGGGQTFIGSTEVTTDSGGTATFSTTLTTPAGQTVFTSTATTADGNTSEFSECATQESTHPTATPTNAPTATPTLTPTASPTPSPTPVPHITTVDDSVDGIGFNQFIYIGSGWNQGRCTPNCYDNTSTRDRTRFDYALFVFFGTQIQLYGVQDSKNGIATVSIDGGSLANVNFYGTPRSGNKLLWTSPVLTRRAHVMLIQVTGTKSAASSNTWVELDKVNITP